MARTMSEIQKAVLAQRICNPDRVGAEPIGESFCQGLSICADLQESESTLASVIVGPRSDRGVPERHVAVQDRCRGQSALGVARLDRQKEPTRRRQHELRRGARSLAVGVSRLVQAVPARVAEAEVQPGPPLNARFAPPAGNGGQDRNGRVRPPSDREVQGRQDARPIGGLEAHGSFGHLGHGRPAARSDAALEDLDARQIVVEVSGVAQSGRRLSSPLGGRRDPSPLRQAERQGALGSGRGHVDRFLLSGTSKAESSLPVALLQQNPLG